MRKGAEFSASFYIYRKCCFRMKRINILESQYIKNLISESLSPVVYHFTLAETVYKILSDNKFRCTLSSNFSDSFSKKHLFYFCLSRVKTIHFSNDVISSSFGNNSNARIEIDGNILNERYKGFPIDYWQSSKGHYDGNKGKAYGVTEYEERVVTDKPYIPNAIKYIRRIDILVEKNLTTWYKKLLETSNELGVPIYFYSNKKDFSLQTKNIINYAVEKTIIEPQTGDSRYRPLNNKVLGLSNLLMLICYDDMYDISRKYEEEGRPMIPNVISPVLDKYGLAHLKDACSRRIGNEIFSMYGNRLSTYVELANRISAGYSGEDIRKLNTHDSDGTDDGEKIVILAADFLRKNGVGNFRELAVKKYNEENAEKSSPILPEVKCVVEKNTWSNENTIRRADDKSLWKYWDKDYFYQEMTRKVREQEDDKNWYEQYGKNDGYTYNEIIHYTSKSADSFIKYLERLINNDSLTLYDWSVIIYKLFDGNLDNMREVIGYDNVFIPILITKKNFLENYANYDWDSRDSILYSLYGTYNNYLKENFPEKVSRD